MTPFFFGVCSIMYYFCSMAKEEIKINGSEPIRIKKSIVNMVRQNKKNTGVPIGRFIEDAILEKIERNKSGKSV